MVQADSYRLFADIVLKIRQSLSLQDILETAVAEVRQLLQCDRVLIYRFNPDWSGAVAMESARHPALCIRSRAIQDPCFERSWLQPYREGRVKATADIYSAGLQDCYRDFLAEFGVRANLVVPVLLSDTPEPLWGLLIAHHCSEPRPWSAIDCDLLQQLANQMAIAIYQAQLLQRQQAELDERRQIEASLRESEARFRRLAENAQDVIYRYCWLPSPRMEYINPAIAELSGYTPGEFYAEPQLLFSLVHRDDLSQFRQQLQPSPRMSNAAPSPRSEPLLTVLRLVHRQGHLIWVEQRCNPLFDQNGRLVALEGIVREISDRAPPLNEAATTALTAAPLGPWPQQVRVFSQGLPRLLRRSNQRFGKQLREPLSSWAMSRWGAGGLMLATIVLGEGLRRAGLPDSSQKLLLFGGLVLAASGGGFRASMVATLTLWGYLATTILLGLGPDWGPLLWFYALATALVAGGVGQVKDASLASAQALNHVNDALEQRVQERTVTLARTNHQLRQEIEERRRAQLAHQGAERDLQQLNQVLESRVAERTATLKASEGRWRHFIDKVRLAVVGIDADGRVNYVNPHFLALTGHCESDVLGHDWFEQFVPRHQIPEARQAFGDFLAAGQPDYRQSVIVTRAREERIIAWNNTLMRNEQGRVQGSLSIGEDITERSAIARMKDEFISVVSHELRTPLTSIHGALELLNSEILPLDSDRGRHLLNIAAENSHRLVHLVNDILQLERLESGKLKLECRALSSRELTQRTQELMEMLLERSHLTLGVSDPGLQVWADGDRVIQVLTNLIDNAIKFSEEGSSIELRVEAFAPPAPAPLDAEIAQVLFCVKDSGRGIPSDQLSGIFERFHQVDASDSRRRGGTGLGLAICRSIVHQHGGQIWVESTLGQGSDFYFTLPAALKPGPVEDSAVA